jgi:hypothetical protein
MWFNMWRILHQRYAVGGWLALHQQPLGQPLMR